MSQENVEIVRRLWQDFQAGLERGDPGAWFDREAVADDLEWIVSTPLEEGRSGGAARASSSSCAPGPSSSMTGPFGSSGGSMRVKTEL